MGCARAPQVERIKNDLPMDVCVSEREPGEYGDIMVLVKSQAPRIFNPMIAEDTFITSD